MLERRLDNVVYRACFASSRAEARQVVKHDTITVNGKKVNIPSYLVKKDDVVKIKAKDEKAKNISEALKVNLDRGVPEWLTLNESELSAIVANLPSREDVAFPIQEQLIILLPKVVLVVLLVN